MTVDGTHSATRLRLDRAVVLVAFLLLGAVTLAAPLLVGISGMRITGCRSTCDTALVGAGGAVVIAGCIGVMVVALVLLVLLRSRRTLWWLPCSALAAAVAILLLGDHLIDLGVGG